VTSRVLIAGSGGQGILMAGKVLAEAAFSEGMNVTWLPSYGAAMRGDTANCTVVISDRTIGSPVAGEVDALLALNRKSLGAYGDMLCEGGLLVMDSTKIKARPLREDMRVVEVPAGNLGDAANARGLANIVLLGVFIGTTGILKPDSVKRAIIKVVIKDIKENQRAFDLGKEFSGH
jgi:2-oxoglutarate ferredoxin oxidoreductase subunit gamma